MGKNIVPNNMPADIPVGYEKWRKELEKLIERSKLKAVIGVNTEMLSLYWTIGRDILEKQRILGWGAQVIDRLSVDLSRRFPDDRGYSIRNLKNMRSFAKAYPHYPIVQVPLAQLRKLPIDRETIYSFTSRKD